MEPELIMREPLHLPSTMQDIPSGWSWARLDEICSGIFDCPHSTPQLSDTGPLMVRSQDIRSGIFRTEEAARVSEKTYRERTARAEPTYGDLLYSREGTYFGIAAEVPPGVRVCLGQRMVLIRPDPEQVNFRYIRYWLNSSMLAPHVYGQRDGTVAERLNLPVIRGLPVPLPPLHEQRVIAYILGTLDDKIELNRRMNETLEAIARALFKSWFVDFDPVRAKAAGRQPAGMDAETAALFPDGFEESALGKIPKGWKVTTLEEVARFFKGVSYKSEDLRDSSMALVTLKSIGRGGGYREEGLKPYAGEYKLQQVIKPGELVVAHTDLTQAAEVLGGVARVRTHSVYSLLVASLDLSIVRPEQQKCSSEYLYSLLRWGGFREHALRYANGTTVLHLSSKALPEFLFTCPPANLIAAFTKYVEPLYAHFDHNEHVSRTLASIRDVLLPKLLSGEIHVKEAEKVMEGAM